MNQWRVGCDVVSIRRFETRLREGGSAFAERIFSPAELGGATVERLAGIFAAKEAALKALGIAAGNWRSLEVTHRKVGAPQLELNGAGGAAGQLSCSISHDGDYAFAVVISSHPERVSPPLEESEGSSP